jgi:hypothetical protein
MRVGLSATVPPPPSLCPAGQTYNPPLPGSAGFATGQGTCTPTATTSSSNPFQGSEGLAIVSIALIAGPLIFLPGWWKALAIAGPLYFLNAWSTGGGSGL